ncbi:MAG: SpoIIE family protein phosphatase, partial [Sporichthyaceae bacterium]|nr:SpoIIE family protein phosphatase [Sporichthyaceae bacterium]
MREPVRRLPTPGTARDPVVRMLDSMADAFLALDASSTVVYLNRAAERLLGTGPGAVGRNLWEVWPALVEAGHDRVFEAAVEMVETRVLTTYLAAEARWFQLRVVPADDGSGSLSVFGTDITAARTAELEQERGLARPEQARRVLAYTAALAQADSLQDVTDTVATMVLPAFGATGMLVALVESGRLRLSGHFGYQQSAVELLEVLNLDRQTAIGQVVATREPLFLPSRAGYISLFPEMEPLIEATGKQAWAFLPLTVSGRALGSLTISFSEVHEFPPEERSLLASVSGLVAQTLALARLRDSERSLAAELQSHLLPRALPQPAGITTRAHYLPATDGMGVGGDWFDVLELPGNRIGLVIGDVQGHNMKAAAVMGQLRNALRAYAAEGHEPAAVLSRTNRLMSDLDPSLFATCCYVALDPLSGRADLTLAGHPGPLLRSADGRVRQLEGPVGPPLGVAPEEEYSTAQVVLGVNDVLVFFTDGLIEDSRRSFDDGLAEVVRYLAGGAVEDLDRLTDGLVASAVEGASRSDDIAVLVVRHDGHPRAARAARDFIAGFLADPDSAELRDTCV